MKAHLVLPALILGAVACQPRVPDEGTFVGNPSSARVRVAPGDGLTFTELELDVLQMDLSSCDGNSTETVQNVGLLELGDPLDLPAGEWCFLTLTVADEIHIVAEANPAVGTGTVDLTLDVPAVQLRSFSPVDFTAAAWVLELGNEGWITAAGVGLADDAVVITPDDPDHEFLANAVSAGSKLFEDADRDGEVSAEERAVGAAMGPSRS